MTTIRKVYQSISVTMTGLVFCLAPQHRSHTNRFYLTIYLLDKKLIAWSAHTSERETDQTYPVLAT